MSILDELENALSEKKQSKPSNLTEVAVRQVNPHEVFLNILVKVVEKYKAHPSETLEWLESLNKIGE